jgi:hypothetical protein
VRAESNFTRSIPVLLAIAAISLGAFMAGGLLGDNDWNPSIFVKFPEAKPVELAYGNEVLGEVIPSGGFGHDGKYYFMQAMDPFFSTPEVHAAHLDRPTYRAQRMIYPTLAGGFGLFSPSATAWNLLVINLVALGIGTWLTSLLAKELGLSPWFGLAFLLNPGVLVSSMIDTAEVLAMLFLVAAALLLLRDRVVASAAFLTLAALTRETMLLATIGAIVYLWHTRRRVPGVFVVPFVATGAWWLFVRAKLGYLGEGIQDTEALGLPFKGFFDALETWLATPGSEVDVMMGVLLLVSSILVAFRAVKDRSLLGLMAAGFVVLAVLMVEAVWRFYFDASRALVPVLTVYILSVAASRKLLKSSEAPLDASVEPAIHPSTN